MLFCIRFTLLFSHCILVSRTAATFYMSLKLRSFKTDGKDKLSWHCYYQIENSLCLSEEFLQIKHLKHHIPLLACVPFSLCSILKYWISAKEGIFCNSVQNFLTKFNKWSKVTHDWKTLISAFTYYALACLLRQF